MVKERPQYFAIISFHEETVVVEARTVPELEFGIEDFLTEPRKKFPSFNFEDAIMVIRGTPSELPKRKVIKKS